MSKRTEEKKDFWEGVEKASREVRGWPEWKRIGSGFSVTRDPNTGTAVKRASKSK